jgi:hypothetical protein
MTAQRNLEGLAAIRVEGCDGAVAVADEDRGLVSRDAHVVAILAKRQRLAK